MQSPMQSIGVVSAACAAGMALHACEALSSGNLRLLALLLCGSAGM